MISKGFRVYIIESDGTEIAHLGVFPSICMQRNGTSTVSTTVAAGALVNSYFSPYTTEPQWIGGLVGAYMNESPGGEEKSAYLLNACPLTIFKDISNYIGKLVKIVNSNGAYAISNAITSQQNVTSYTLYNSDGTQVQYVASRGSLPLPFYQSNGIRCMLGTENNGRIESAGRAELTVSMPYTDTRAAVDVLNVVNNAAQSVILNWWNGLEHDAPPGPPSDPYAEGGASETGGGKGSFDGTGDNIDIPGLPTLSATSTGFITLFNPSIGQLQELSTYMWSNGFDLETFKKLFADPMDCILGLSIVPVAIPNGETSTVSVGNISTGVSMTKAASQYVTVDCGTLNVNEYWGAYLDYDPYTKAEIYLPYIGTHALSVDDIMGKSVHVVYHVDILSGACAAYVKCGGSVLYSFIGQCSSSIPISGNDWTNVINGVLSIAGAVGSMVATGGASAPMAAGMIASTAVNGLKPNVEKSGSMSGTGGMLGVQTPYLILTRPRQALPARQNTFTGYPSFITSKLGSLSGYTEIEEIHLENIPGTEPEISEIENLLKRGVII